MDESGSNPRIASSAAAWAGDGRRGARSTTRDADPVGGGETRRSSVKKESTAEGGPETTVAGGGEGGAAEMGANGGVVGIGVGDPSTRAKAVSGLSLAECLTDVAVFSSA